MMGYGYSYEIADLVIPESLYETRKLNIGIITAITNFGVPLKPHDSSRKYKVFWLTTDGAHVILWHSGEELKMISPHEGFTARFAKYRV